MKLADKTIFNIIAKSSHAFLLLISSIVFTRFLTKLEYGTYLQVMLIVNTTIALTFFGLPESIFYFTPYVDRRDKFIIRNIVISSVIAIAISISIYLLRNYLTIWLNNDQLANLGWLIALIVMFRAPSKFAEPFFISNNYLRLNAIFIVVENILIYFPVIIAAFLGKSTSYILGVMVFSSGFVLLIFLSILIKIILEIKRNFSIDDDVKEKISIVQQIRYSLPIGFSSHLSILGKQLDQYLVSVFFLPMDFAVYSRGAIRIPVLGKIHLVINRVLMPKYVESYKNRNMKDFFYYYHKSIKKVAKIKYPLFTFLFVVSPSIITILFTEKYLGAVWVLRCYLLSLVINIVTSGLIPRVSGETGCLLYATTLSLIVNFVLSIMLIKIIGALGAALATLCAGVVSIFYILNKSCQILNISIRKIWPWEFLLKLFGMTMVAVSPVFVLEYLVSFSNVPIIIMLVVKVLIYFYLVILFLNHKGFIKQDEFDLVNRWLKFDARALINKLTFVKSDAITLK